MNPKKTTPDPNGEAPHTDVHGEDGDATALPPPPPVPTATTEDDVIGNPKESSLARSSAVMAAGTLVSRLLGFARWALLLIAIGGVGANDAFQVANTLPNTVFNLLAAGLLDAILVPQIVRAFKTRSGSVYVNRLLTLAGVILFGLTLLMIAGASVLVTISAAEMAPQWKSLAVIFAVWCLPQIFFYGLYSLLGEFLNARGIFGPYMWTPVANNVIGILGLLLFMAVYGTSSNLSDPTVWDFNRTALLAAPATLGVIVQAVLLFLPLRRAGVRLRLDFHFRGTGLRSASTITAWVFATLVVGQVGFLSTSNIAAAANQWWDETGTFAASTSALSYTFMVYMLPQSIISVSIATAIFTRLAAAAADRDEQRMVEQYQFGVRTTSLLVMWLTAILGAGAVPVFQALGPNNPIEHMQAYAQVLVVTLPGMAGACVILFSQRVFYALEDARPVFYTVLAPTIMQIALGWTLKAFLPATLWLVGAVFAETLSRVCQGVISVFLVRRKLPGVSVIQVLSDMLRYAVFAAISGVLGYFALRLVGTYAQASSTWLNFLGAAWRGIYVAMVVSVVYAVLIVVLDQENCAGALTLLARRIPALEGVVARLGTLRTGRGKVGYPDKGIRRDQMADDTPTPSSAEDPRDGGDQSNLSGDPQANGRGDDINAEAERERQRRVEEYQQAQRQLTEQLESGQLLRHLKSRLGSHSTTRGSWNQAYEVDSYFPAVKVNEGGEVDAAAADDPELTGPAAGSHSEAEDGIGASRRAGRARGETGIPLPPPPPSSTPSDPADEAEPWDEPVSAPPPPEFDEIFGYDAGNAQPSEEEEEDAQHRSFLANKLGLTGVGRRLRSAGEPMRLTFNRAGNPIMKLEGGTRVLSKSLSSVRTTIDELNAGNRVDPTRPTLALFAVGAVVAAIFASVVLWSSTPDFSADEDEPVPTAIATESAGSEGGAATDSPQAAPGPAPQIQRIKIISYNDDGGDHQEWAQYLIDGDPATMWQSRYFAQPDLPEGNTIRMVITLKEAAAVSEVSFTGPISGGQVDLRVNDGTDPFGTPIITSAKMAENTVLKPGEPTRGTTVTLNFSSLPTDDEGRHRVKISELKIK